MTGLATIPERQFVGAVDAPARPEVQPPSKVDELRLVTRDEVEGALKLIGPGQSMRRILLTEFLQDPRRSQSDVENAYRRAGYTTTPSTARGNFNKWGSSAPEELYSLQIVQEEDHWKIFWILKTKQPMPAQDAEVDEEPPAAETEIATPAKGPRLELDNISKLMAGNGFETLEQLRILITSIVDDLLVKAHRPNYGEERFSRRLRTGELYVEDVIDLVSATEMGAEYFEGPPQVKSALAKYAGKVNRLIDKIPGEVMRAQLVEKLRLL